MRKILLGTAALLALTLSQSSFAFCWWNCSSAGYTETKYPIVLVHGAIGFDTLFGFIDYWHGIPSELERSGADVYVTQVSAIHHPSVRGEQLLIQVNEVLAATGKDKVNLIGHSLGSPTARYIATLYPEKVASVVSIGGSNRTNGGLAAEGDSDIAAFFITLAGKFVDASSNGGLPQDGAALGDYGTHADEFNDDFPEGLPPIANNCLDGDLLAPNGVYYMSWTGAKAATNALDPSDYVLVPLGIANENKPNDGPVGVCESHLGLTIRDDYRFNHLDETNLFFGLGNIFEVKPPSIYRQVANRLKNYGL